MKYIIAITLLSVGCAITERDAPPVILPEVVPEGFLTPLDIEDNDLLYHYPNIVRKSTTKEDYFPPKEVA